MHRILVILFTCIAFSAFGQKNIEIKDINGTKTSKHVNIPGTRLYIIPPSGFTVAKSFMGLQKDDNTGIMVMDLDGGNFYTNAETFSKSEFEKSGVKVFDYKEFKTNGFPTKCILVQAKGNTHAVSLVFGDTTFSTMITATYPSSDKVTSEQIQNALKTICYDKSLKVDPLASAPFTLDESKSIFKFHKSASGIFMYSVGGKEHSSESGKPMIMVISLPKDQSMNPKNISESMLSSTEKYGFSDKELKNESTDDVNGMVAYEVENYGKMKGENCIIYQLTVTNNEQAVSIQSIITADPESYIKEIKKFARTVKMK